MIEKIQGQKTFESVLDRAVNEAADTHAQNPKLAGAGIQLLRGEVRVQIEALISALRSETRATAEAVHEQKQSANKVSKEVGELRPVVKQFKEQMFRAADEGLVKMDESAGNLLVTALVKFGVGEKTARALADKMRAEESKIARFPNTR